MAPESDAAASPSTCDPVAPRLNDPAEALGFHYVMTGSALGGRVMLRELERAGVDIAGLGFLNPYGARTGEVWRDLLNVLERNLAGDAAALAAALRGDQRGCRRDRCSCAGLQRKRTAA